MPAENCAGASSMSSAGNGVKPATGWGATRRSAVLGSLVLGGLVTLMAMPVWLTATGSSAIARAIDLSVTGATAAPGVTAAGLALLAAGAATLLVGPAGSWVIGSVIAIASVVVTGSALTVISGADAVAATAARAATGVAVVVGEPQLTFAPYLTTLLGVIGIALAVWVVAGGKTWRVSARHERPRASSGPNPGDEAGGLSPNDVTGTAGDAAGDGEKPAAESSGGHDPDHLDVAGLWDEQSKER